MIEARFIPSREPLVDLRTGMITRTWFLLFQTLFDGARTGGVSYDEAFLLAPMVPPAEQAVTIVDDLSPPTCEIFMQIDDVLPVIGALRDEIAMLRREIDDLRKGTFV